MKVKQTAYRPLEYPGESGRNRKWNKTRKIDLTIFENEQDNYSKGIRKKSTY